MDSRSGGYNDYGTYGMESNSGNGDRVTNVDMKCYKKK